MIYWIVFDTSATYILQFILRIKIATTFFKSLITAGDRTRTHLIHCKLRMSHVQKAVLFPTNSMK